MADPRLQPVQNRKNPLSKLMKAKAESTNGEKVNACPFGCTIEDLDDNGYCHHLVGFTNDGKAMEPMVVDEKTQKRVVRVPLKDGKPILAPVLKGDHLEPISVSSRVYRDTAKAAKAS